jgi:subtilisin-like proprotein convertase family protein
VAAVLTALFALFVTAGSAGAAVFSNASSITIPSSGQGTPYPSTVTVSGLMGMVTNVDVTLTNYNHTYPGDVDVLLVSPSGQKVILMTNVGGATDAVNATLTLDDAALAGIPSPVVSGTYRPTNVGAFNGTAPAPAGPYSTALVTFNGFDPNGTWSLYVYDDLVVFGGSIAGGWSLDVTTNGPTLTTFAPAQGPAGTQVVLTGTNFTGATSVAFGGVAATAFTVDSATQITTTVPVGAVSGPITVVTPNGHASSMTLYQVVPAPAVMNFTPKTGKVGANVVIHGAMLAGATEVRIGGVPVASFTVVSEAQITTRVPAGAGTGPVSVTTPGGTATSVPRFVVRHARDVSLSVTKTRAKGRVTAEDGFARAASNVRVRLQRKVGGTWMTVATKVSAANGRYSFSSRNFAGRFRVVAPLVTVPSGDVALRAVSPTARR